MLKDSDLCHILQSEDFLLPTFPLPRTFLSERNSLDSVDWPPTGSSLLPEGENAPKDDNIFLTSPVSDVLPRPLLIDMIAYTCLRRPRKPGMNQIFAVERCCRRSRNWMNLKFWKGIRHLTATVGLLAQMSPRQWLIPSFQDPRYPTTITSFGVCPNETAPPVHRQFGFYPPLDFDRFDVKLTFP